MIKYKPKYNFAEEQGEQTWFISSLYYHITDPSKPGHESQFVNYIYGGKGSYYGLIADAVEQAQIKWPDSDGWEITDRMAAHTTKHFFKETA
jgi:hypothetical protein